ncbi:hypothetical protein L3Q82_009167 [Scortum barcoo]|uniref:Uncharacterized protein n=1 Tax=Scortum barcoo TaxID=214431 RepID=A0ACB8XBZ1_9TELE|nr:hypothetical protein L3Q82_009167 [Scortum barcoo]
MARLTLMNEVYAISSDVQALANQWPAVQEQQGPLRRPDWRYRGPTLEPGLGLGLAGECLVDGSGRAQLSLKWRRVGPPSSRLTTRRKVHEGLVQCGLGSNRGGGASTTQSLDQNSGNRDMECHLAGGEGA